MRLVEGEGRLIVVPRHGDELKRYPISNVHISSIFFSSERVGWAVGSKRKIYLSEDGGKTWKKKPQKISVGLNQIYCVDNDTCFVVGDDGIIIKTSDRGRKWQKLVTNTTSDLTAVHFANPMVGWAAGDCGTVLKTNTGGLTWERPEYLTNGEESTLWPDGPWIIDIHFVDENTGWLATQHGVFRTTDGGDKWSYTNLPLPLSIIAVVSGDGKEVIAVDRRGPVKGVSTDGGKTWKAKND